MTESILVDGATYTGTVTQLWVVGSTHTISAADRTLSNGYSADFVRWSDGGAQNHTVTANTSLTLYRADFAMGYSVTASAATGGGTVTLSPQSATGIYAANSSVTLTATPSAGYCFTGWSGLIAGTPAITTLSVTKSYAVAAQFAAAAFSISQTLAYAGGDGGTYSVGVTTSAGCSWSVQSMSDWIRVPAASGTGNGTASYIVEPTNLTSARVGILWSQAKRCTSFSTRETKLGRLRHRHTVVIGPAVQCFLGHFLTTFPKPPAYYPASYSHCSMFCGLRRRLPSCRSLQQNQQSWEIYEATDRTRPSGLRCVCVTRCATAQRTTYRTRDGNR